MGGVTIKVATACGRSVRRWRGNPFGERANDAFMRRRALAGRLEPFMILEPFSILEPSMTLEPFISGPGGNAFGKRATDASMRRRVLAGRLEPF